MLGKIVYCHLEGYGESLTENGKEPIARTTVLLAWCCRGTALLRRCAPWAPSTEGASQSSSRVHAFSVTSRRAGSGVRLAKRSTPSLSIFVLGGFRIAYIFTSTNSSPGRLRSRPDDVHRSIRRAETSVFAFNTYFRFSLAVRCGIAPTAPWPSLPRSRWSLLGEFSSPRPSTT